MRHFLPLATIFGALALSAQPWPNQGPGPGRYERRYSGSDVLDRTRADLRRASSQGYYGGHERSHFEHAFRELDRFRANWSRGRFDNHALDRAIENIDHLAHADRLHPRDREILRQDLWALRDFRSRGGYSDRFYGDRRDRW